MGDPSIVAHRGGAGLRPENTLAAFAHALALGADAFELDVQLTRDGHVVVHHYYRPKPAIARDPAGRWIGHVPPVRELTLDELRTYDVGRLDPDSRYADDYPDQIPCDGERIPKLAEVIALVEERAPQTRLWVELKTSRREPAVSSDPGVLTEAVVQLLRSSSFEDRALLLCFDWSALARAREISPDLPRVHTVASGLHGRATSGGRNPIDVIVGEDGDWWFPQYRDVTPAAVERARAADLKVATWTPNDEAELRRLVDLGLDAICTDYPDRLAAILGRG